MKNNNGEDVKDDIEDYKVDIDDDDDEDTILLLITYFISNYNCSYTIMYA